MDEDDLEVSTNNEELLQVHFDLVDDDTYELGSKNVGSVNSIQNVKGNLRKHIQFLRDIGTSMFLLKVIQEGYRLPFKTIPAPTVLKNNNSAKCHQQFVQEALEELIRTGRVVQSQTTPHIINPLSVSIQANGKKRLILDLRYVHKCVDTKRVKYEHWKVALSYFEQDAYMFSFDLKSGYHHIEIHAEHQTFLGFAWENRNYRVSQKKGYPLNSSVSAACSI